MGDELDLLKSAIGSVTGKFKFGTGFMGRSATALSLLIVAGVFAMWRLHSEIAILAVFLVLVIVGALWYASMRKHVQQHPADALLEGATWESHKRFEATAKIAGTSGGSPIEQPRSLEIEEPGS